jgi:glycosyltransferase involved in cell wall biosynthesis
VDEIASSGADLTSLNTATDHDIAGAAGHACPRVSVVVPALNEAAFLPRCLHALALQDYTGGYEVIEVDNNSTDATSDVALAHGATVVREPRPGVCAARQRGTEAARGEIVVSTDADTTVGPQWLSRIAATFDRDASCVCVAGPCQYRGGPWWGLAYIRVLFGLVCAVFRVTGHVFYVTATNLAFRKSAWSGYDLNLTQGGDEVDLLRRLRKRGRVVFLLDNPSLTSPRRLNNGLFYNLFVTFGYFYFLGYWLNHLSGRQIIGTAPAFRTESRPALSRWSGTLRTGAIGVVVVVVLGRLVGIR